MPKLAHTKSTKGCKRCKQRKVKVSRSVVYERCMRRTVLHFILLVMDPC